MEVRGESRRISRGGRCEDVKGRKAEKRKMLGSEMIKRRGESGSKRIVGK